MQRQFTIFLYPWSFPFATGSAPTTSTAKPHGEESNAEDTNDDNEDDAYARAMSEILPEITVSSIDYIANSSCDTGIIT